MRRNAGMCENGEFSFYPMVTRGPGGRTRDAHSPNVIVKVNGNVSNGRLAPLYDTGVHGVIVRTRSYPAQSLDPKVKHHSRNNFALADLEAADIDPEGYPILTDLDGFLTEGISYNLFMVTDGVIRTPTDKHILQGVTRAVVVELAEQLGIPCNEEDLQPYDMYTADEAFIASTSPCVLPMTRVDTRTVGDGKPGPIVKQLLAAFGELAGVDIVDLARRDAAREAASG
ncbi:MAG: aminotransferase class IV [Chloroflexi bacterium]|nr:aminotransferase class IV [Chloroflexota bacterium]